MTEARFLAGITPFQRHFGRPLSRDKADTLLLLIACSMVLLPHVSHLPWWISLTSIALLIWRGWITFRGNRMPPVGLLIPVSLAAMAEVYLQYKTFFGRDAGVAMLTMLIACKLLEMHARRDLFVVIFLSFFLMLTNFFYSQSIGMALQMIAAVIFILTAQLSFQYTGTVPPFSKRLGMGVLIFALAAPLSLVLFVLFPRIQGPLWGLPGDANTGRSGMSDTMTPGNITSLALSDDIAFRVKFMDPIPEKQKQYWRGIVMGNYDGRTWTRLRKPQNSMPQVNIQTHGAQTRYRVTLEPNGSRWIFMLELPASIPTLEGHLANVTNDMQFSAPFPISERIRYDAISYSNFDFQAGETLSGQQEWLALPTGFNPNTLAFAASLKKQSAGKLQLVNQVLKYFREQAFSYTLDPPSLGKHAVDDFLFLTRAGFCEHYSSAFVVLMRAMGIPARVVTGYQGGEHNPVDDFFTIRQSDAHAWAEIWLENRGWLRVDPTAAVAPERIELNLANAVPRSAFGGLLTMNIGKDSWLGKANLNWNAMTNGWNQWVLNYTPRTQQNLLKSLGFEQVDWRILTILMFLFGSIAMSIAVFPLLIQRKNIKPLDELYGIFGRKLARQGYPREVHEGPQTYLERLDLIDGLKNNAAISDFLQQYTNLQYGKSGTRQSAADLARLKYLLTIIR